MDCKHSGVVYNIWSLRWGELWELTLSRVWNLDIKWTNWTSWPCLVPFGEFNDIIWQITWQIIWYYQSKNFILFYLALISRYVSVYCTCTVFEESILTELARVQPNFQIWSLQRWQSSISFTAYPGQHCGWAGTYPSWQSILKVSFY